MTNRSEAANVRASCSNLLNPSSNNRPSRSSSRTNRRSIQKLQELKAVVEKAVQNHKTFTVLGPFACIKNALKLRGWIEKLENKNRNGPTGEVKAVDKVVGCRESNSVSVDNENALDEFQISRLLRDYCVDFVWTMKNEPIRWKKLCSKTMVSRFPRAEFTTKAGLCASMQQLHWYHEESVSAVLFPRCYNIFNEEELSIFTENFRITACISLIKFIYESAVEEKMIFKEDGTIALASVYFAIQRCKEYIAQQQHKDVDQKEVEKVWDHQWDQFLTNYYQTVHNGAFFTHIEENEISNITEQCKIMLEELADYWSQMHLDGVNNFWILKPAAKSRGRGILLMKRLEDILSKINSPHSKEAKYVAQKYIERPLLIYETKFDIRQWFLVTCAFPLTIWMYKESYLRFCSQVFSLINTHESVHLSNNAVQCKYTNGKRDQNLPDENMWDCYTFQTYLRAKGLPEVWKTIIYPGMRQSIICTLLASQDTMDTRKNCFELFGADFMLSERFEPWLIEINSGPSMSSSTSVTARMCAQVLDDVIKVVIDRKHNKNADTGMFELVYKQNIPPAQPYMGQNLIIRGTNVETLLRSKMDKRKNTQSKKRKSSNESSSSDKSNILDNRSNGMKSYLDSVQNKKDCNCVRVKWEKVDKSTENKENFKNNNCRNNRRLNRKNCKHVGKTESNPEAGKCKEVSIGTKNDRQFPFVKDGTKRKLTSASLSTKQGKDGDAFPKII